MSRLLRLLTVALAALALVGLVRWLAGKPVVRFSLGAGEELVAEPGIGSFAVREAEGLWRLYDERSRKPAHGRLLPAPVTGRPALQADGSVFVLTDQGLVWVHGSQPLSPGGELVAVLRAGDLPGGAVLEGVVGPRDALLSVAAEGGRRLLLCEGGAVDARLVPVADERGEALVPDGAALVLCRGARELAFLGERGWEAWSLPAGALARRVVAEGCLRPGAVFLPQGGELLVHGRTEGLWLLSLADGRMKLVSEGDLGVSRRVPESHGWRHDPLRLAASQWDEDGWLQIGQIHVPSGRRWRFSLGLVHHYGVSVSADGRFMAYVQSDFDEEGDAPFAEALYRFDFDRSSPGAVKLGTRRGGRAHRGPVFIGRGGSLVHVANGEVLRSEGSGDS